jgi:ribose 5-phosphate isomerase B
MKIAIGSDHAGFLYKEKIRAFLEELGHRVTDFGTHSEDAVDYPVFIAPVASAVARQEFERGVILGGSGNGEAIVANRFKGIRAAVCWNAESARLSRQHNNANIISLGQRMMTEEVALEVVRIWLETPFEGGRHQRRIELIDSPQILK